MRNVPGNKESCIHIKRVHHGPRIRFNEINTCIGREGALRGGTCSFRPGPENTSSCVRRFFMRGEGDKYPGAFGMAPLFANEGCMNVMTFMWCSFWNNARLSSLPSKFLQSTHLQLSEQRMFAWKHSQYFLRHPDFLQWHPLLCLPAKGCSPRSSCNTKATENAYCSSSED